MVPPESGGGGGAPALGAGAAFSRHVRVRERAVGRAFRSCSRLCVSFCCRRCSRASSFAAGLRTMLAARRASGCRALPRTAAARSSCELQARAFPGGCGHKI